MDRKNKRAEQQAAKGASPAPPTATTQGTPTRDRERGDGNRNSSQEKRDITSSKSGAGPIPSGIATAAPGRPSSLSISSRPPMTIGKAAPTVSTIASDPSMHDADFHQSSGDSRPRRGSGIATSFAAAVAAGISPNQPALSALRPSSLSTNTAAQGSSSGITAAMAANGRDSPLTPATGNMVSSESPNTPSIEPESEPSPIPQSRPAHRPNHSSDLGFGPIGSPPATSRLGTSPGRSPQSGGIALARARLPNGLSPSVSSPPPPGFDLDAPPTSTLGSPPTSSSAQPASSSLFMPYGQGGSVPARMTPLSQLQAPSSTVEPHGASSGVGRPLGAQRSSAWAGSLPASTFLGDSMNINSNAVAEEGDLEDFLPSSLNELLTPGERSRRLSKSNLSRPRFDPDSGPAGSGAGAGITPQLQRETVHAPQPRFVSSVPTASLLNNFRGIWDDTLQTNDASSGVQPASGGVEAWSRNSGRLSAGISGSLGGVDVPSPSLLGTSNASAAFLPGHPHRTATTGLSHSREPPLIGGASASFDPRASTSRFNTTSDLALSPPRYNGLPSSQSSNTGGFGSSGIFVSNQGDTSYYGMHDASSNSRQPHSSTAHLANQYMALSPTSARALRAHEPGQSLPQGLAAGLSRLHLVPATNPVSPPAVSASPSASMSMSIASTGGAFAAQQSAYGNWLKSTSGEMSPPPFGLSNGGIASPPRFANNAGLSTLTSNASAASYPILSRGPPGTGSGRREVSWTSQAQASPLSRPTVPDDDTVFDMDA